MLQKSKFTHFGLLTASDTKQGLCLDNSVTHVFSMLSKNLKMLMQHLSCLGDERLCTWLDKCSHVYIALWLENSMYEEWPQLKQQCLYVFRMAESCEHSSRHCLYWIQANAQA